MYKDAPSTYQKLFNINKSNSPYNESNYIKNSDDDIYDTQNLWNVIPLSTINSVNKKSLNDLEAFDIDIKKYGERLLLLSTIKKEKLILRAQNNYARDRWYEIIKDIVEQAQIDKYFYKYNNEINEGIKTLYLTKLQFIYKLLNIKGIIALKEARKIFFENFDNIVLKKIIEFCVDYKFGMIKKNNFKSYEQIKNLVEFLGVNYFDEDTNFLLDKETNNEELEDAKGFINKNYVIKHLIDEETHIKLSNIYEAIKTRTLSFKASSKNVSFNKKARLSSFNLINNDEKLLDNLYTNIITNHLSKEHKKNMKNNTKNYLTQLSKINSIQFCKYNNFNINKMNLLCKEEKENNIIPDVFSDLDEFL